MNWYLAAIRNYTNFNGRARRKEYWMFYLFNMIITLVLYVTRMVLTSSRDSSEAETVFLVLNILYTLFILIPSIALIVRRLHDQDKSGAWYFIALIPFIGPFWFLILMCTEGTYGPNQYGDDPKPQDDRISIVDTPVVDTPVVDTPIVHTPDVHTHVVYTPIAYTPIVQTPERTDCKSEPITVTGLKLSKTQANSGEVVLAEISCQNSGDEIKECILTLYMNGVAMQKKNINIPPNSQGAVVMQVPPSWNIGEYTVKVGSCSQKLMIV